jgi:two-component system sensor histidine kinase UhpB
VSAKAGKAKRPPARPPLTDDSLERLLSEGVFEAIGERDLETNVINWSGNFESIFGHPREEVIGHLDWWNKHVHPDDGERVMRIAGAAIRGTAKSFLTEYRFRRKDGSWAWVAARGVIVRDAQGKARRVVGALLDISTLKQTDEALRENRELFRTVVSTLPVGVVVMDRSGNVALSNPASDRIWGHMVVSGSERWRQSVGYWHATGARIEPTEWASIRALSDGATSLNELIDIETVDGHKKIIENSAAPIRDPDGTIVGAVVINQDVTERVRAEEALRGTQRLLLDAERLGLTGSWEMNLISGEVVNSDSTRRLFFGDDKTKGEQLDDYVDVIHPDDRQRVMRSREAMLDGTGPGDIEYRVIWPDGSEHTIFGRATVVRDESGRAIRVYGTNADITERKHAEEELARRARLLELLSRKLIQAQEAERRAVALELHDDLGQMLFGLKLSLQRSGRDETESIALVDGAIGRMRDLVQALRPPLLDEFGLPAALSAYVEREANRAGLAFVLAIEPLERRLPVTIEVTCFRVAQEALTNVIRHAQAREVDVELTKTSDRLELIVRDNGRGFDVAAARRQAAMGASHGLLSMQERVALVGGELEIESTPEKGTTVRARLPCSTPKPLPAASARRPKRSR